MFSTIWHTVFFDPVYNGLVFFIDAIPGGDVGLAIICITVLVKFVLLPLSISAAKTQKAMRVLEPKLSEIKEKHKDSKEEQARATMEAYKEAGVKPLASVALLFLQIPIIIALYLSVSRGGGVPLPGINIEQLYSFIPVPESVNMIFLGLVDISKKSLVLALLAGVTQFFQAKFAMPKPPERKPEDKPSFKTDLAHSMHIQMRYVMPAVIFMVAYSISASIALYFTVSNLVAIAQELVVRKHR